MDVVEGKSGVGVRGKIRARGELIWGYWGWLVRTPDLQTDRGTRRWLWWGVWEQVFSEVSLSEG